MTKNIGSVDRVIRFVIGVALIATGVVLAGKGLWWLALVGLVPLGTAFIRVCPLYLPFKINTGAK